MLVDFLLSFLLKVSHHLIILLEIPPKFSLHKCGKKRQAPDKFSKINSCRKTKLRILSLFQN